LAQQDATPPVSLSTVIDCHPGQNTLVAIPGAKVRVITAANLLRDQPPRILNADLWDQAVAGSCLDVAPPDPESGLTNGPVRYLRSGSALTLLVDIRNNGEVPAEAVPSLDADGFDAVPVPDSVLLRPGQVVHEVLHVTVANCHLAQTGEVNGLTIAANTPEGADTPMLRQLDRLATRTCAKE
jgi:hypothetical protein